MSIVRYQIAGAATSTPAVASGVGLPGTQVILFGTSLELLAGTGPDTLDPATSAAAVGGRGWYHWCNAFLGQRLSLVRNAGVGGNTSAQMLARLAADVLAYDSDWVLIGGPVNDMANDIASATTITNLTSIIDAILDDGRKVLMLTAAPSTSYSTTGRRAAVSDVNRWIRALPSFRRDVVVADAHRVLVDPATGSPAAGMAIDAVHYSDAAAMRLGETVAAALAPLVPVHPPRVVPVVDPRNTISNPHMASGTGWSTVNGAAATYSADDDTWAGKVALTIAGGADALERGILYVENISGARFAVGDVIQASARFRWSGLTPVGIAVLCSPFLRVLPRRVDNSFGAGALAFSTASIEQQIPAGVPPSGELVAVTHRFTIPATTDRLYVTVGWVGAASASVEVSDLAVHKVA